MPSPVNLTTPAQPSAKSVPTPAVATHASGADSSNFHTHLRDASAKKSSGQQGHAAETHPKPKPADSTQSATKSAPPSGKTSPKTAGKPVVNGTAAAKSRGKQIVVDEHQNADLSTVSSAEQSLVDAEAPLIVPEAEAETAVFSEQSKQAVSQKKTDSEAAAALLAAGSTTAQSSQADSASVPKAAQVAETSRATPAVIALDSGLNRDSTATQSSTTGATEGAPAQSQQQVPASASTAAKGITGQTARAKSESTAETETPQIALNTTSRKASNSNAAMQSFVQTTSDIADAIASVATSLGADDAAPTAAARDQATALPTTLTTASAAVAQSAITASVTPKDAPAPQPVVSQFAAANHPQIVTGVQTQVLPHGGTMSIRLDPPELGVLQVTVTVHNGVVNASFQTANDEATRMLSHSLGQLKTALESHGMNVDKIQVQQTPKDQKSSGGGEQPPTPQDQQQARQEQQRKQMLQQMWAKVAGLSEPMDLVA